ncbi:DUF6545 domain-containing protein [Streptomyces sp. NPDC006512]|uniref:DUF6545 domain-containing protein n=1 Tax=Streptomyces sp. NPDC006512 TaxID=3154307 RepID=UPI0033A56387
MYEGVNYYVSAAVLGVTFLAKLPALLRRWRSPTVRAVNALLVLPCAGLLLSAPPTIRFVNRVTGIANLSALLVHCTICGIAYACVVLMEYWRGEAHEQARTRRRVRAWSRGYGLVTASIVVLFFLGDRPVERPRDFDTYYATTPFIREMVVLYLLAFVVAGVATVRACWRWAVELSTARRCPDVSRGWGALRTGLLVFVVVSLAGVLFGSFKLVAILARWAGHDWEGLNQGATLLMSLTGVIIGLGFLVAAFGPRLGEHVWRPLLTIIALRHLWRIVCHPVTGAGNSLLLTTPWYSSPEQHLVARITSIHDWMLKLRAYCSDEVRAAAYQQAKDHGEREDRAVAIGLATMLRAATAARARQAGVDDQQSARAAASLRSAEAVYPDIVVRVSRVLPFVPEGEPATATRAPAG